MRRYPYNLEDVSYLEANATRLIGGAGCLVCGELWCVVPGLGLGGSLVLLLAALLFLLHEGLVCQVMSVVKGAARCHASGIM